MNEFTLGRTRPCSGCPWRVGNESRSVVDVAAHERARETFTERDGFHPVMACHMNPAGLDGACVGYLLSEHALQNLSVRVAIAMGALDLATLEADGPLYERYDAWEPLHPRSNS